MKRWWLRILFLVWIDVVPMALYGQGCTQCADNAASTPPGTQAAYRHAILLLGSAAVTVFVAVLALFRRYR